MAWRLLGSRRRVTGIGLGALGWALAAAAACREPPPPAESGPVEVLLVGLDGASWEFIDPLLERGALPNLAALLRRGTRAHLRTLDPSLSPAVWTTMATGRSPEAHGIDDFMLGEGAEARGASSGARRTEALWTILSRAGRRVGFVGWWVTWPAEAVSGYMVSEQFLLPTRGELEHATYPPGLAARLDVVADEDWPWLRESIDDGRLRLLPDLDPRVPLSPTDRLEHARFYYGQDYRAEQFALHLLESEPHPALFSVTLRKVDGVSHYAWQFLDAGARDARSYSRILEPVYRYEDALLGRLIEASGPAEHVLVVSDHGFERKEQGWDHKHAAPPGILVAAGPAFRQESILEDGADVRDLAPTLLHLLGVPVGRDMEGRVLEEAFAVRRPVRWVDTHETGRRARRDERSPLEDEIRERLRALGYVE